MVKNAEGLVAIRHHSSNPSKPVQVGDKIYQALPKNNISLMWVEENDVEPIVNSPLNKTKTCNCGSGASKPLFNVANELDVCLWETGTRCK